MLRGTQSRLYDAFLDNWNTDNWNTILDPLSKTDVASLNLDDEAVESRNKRIKAHRVSSSGSTLHASHLSATS
eukprot:SAG11_NODE_2766_length_2998_cov_1.572611_4_plen_72_part_01